MQKVNFVCVFLIPYFYFTYIYIILILEDYIYLTITLLYIFQHTEVYILPISLT